MPDVVGVTKTPLPLSLGTINKVCFTKFKSKWSKTKYCPFLGVIVKESLSTKALISSAKRPAALIKTLHSNSLSFLQKTETEFSLILILFTSWLSNNSTPLSIAFSIKATVNSNGLTIPQVGANSAPLISLFNCGSNFKTSSLERIFVSTLFSFALFCKESNVFISSSVVAIVNEPFWINGTSSSLHIWGYIELPKTFICAFNELGKGSYPEWTIALLAADVSLQTSLFFSSNTVLNLYLDNSRAIAQPITPPPTIITS